MQIGRVKLWLAPFLLSASVGSAQTPRAQAAQVDDRTLAAVAGIWKVTAMVGPTDSVVATYQLIARGNRDGWTVMLPNRPPLPVRIVAAGGDSIVTVLGPFASILRAGQMVTTRTTWHYHGGTMTGTIEAVFSAGDTLREKATAIRQRP
ncbi:MAG: hypothetical protein HY700_10335 [Gemmatimonadetes bacterium]|nr:hypothetical protein [Gemmatimonadota bacterium]